jgi:hypothetical protein
MNGSARSSRDHRGALLNAGYPPKSSSAPRPESPTTTPSAARAWLTTNVLKPSTLGESRPESQSCHFAGIVAASSSTVTCFTPSSRAVAAATAISSSPWIKPKPTVKAVTCGVYSRAIEATIVLSMPADRNTPTGTSATRWRSTPSWIRSRTSRAACGASMAGRTCGNRQ